LCHGKVYLTEGLEEREAELLRVPYFHVVFTLPGPIADIAYQNKAVIYDILFKASAETMIATAADPKRLGRTDRHNLRAAQLRLGNDASPACAPNRTGRRNVRKRESYRLKQSKARRRR
jgi:hypothetical protein